MVALSPKLRDMIDEAKVRNAANDDESEILLPSIRAQLAWLGFQKATKRELQRIILNAMEADPEA